MTLLFIGRANFGAPHNYEQKKGLWEGDVLLDEVRVLILFLPAETINWFKPVSASLSQ